MSGRPIRERGQKGEGRLLIEAWELWPEVLAVIPKPHHLEHCGDETEGPTSTLEFDSDVGDLDRVPSASETRELEARLIAGKEAEHPQHSG